MYNELFMPRCMLCHNDKTTPGGVNAESFDNIVYNLSKIQDRVLKRQSMPPDTPLTPYENTLLSTWIQAGTPYNAAPSLEAQ